MVSAATEHARIVTRCGSVPFVVSTMILTHVGPNRARSFRDVRSEDGFRLPGFVSHALGKEKNPTFYTIWDAHQ